MNRHILRRAWLRVSSFFVLFLGLFLLIFANTQYAYSAEQLSLEMGNLDTKVFELLRLHVSSDDREAWLNAEKASWEPWLAKQNGFVERKLFWDQEKEEAILLITWESRDQWKAIPQEEVDAVQKKFEKLARDSTGKITGNPFPLRSQSELLPQ